MGLEPLAWAEIDLSALAHNYQLARRLAGTSTRIYGVVKGDAYGVGASRAAATLVACGADGLAAGEVEEALTLKSQFRDLRVMLYGAYAPERIPEIAAQGVSPTLFSRECIRVAVSARQPISAFLEVDCGFGRLGLLEDETHAALETIRSSRHIELKGIYTHLGAVEDPVAVREQSIRFHRIASTAETLGFRGLERMVASSRVLLSYAELKLDAVNPGRLLYGLLEPPWCEQVDVMPVFRKIRSQLIQVKDLAPGRRIGYGESLPSQRGTVRSGVAVIGFATGLPRALAGAPALVRGRRISVIGLASMEHVLLDLTDVPSAEVGDEVVFVGSQGDERITGTEFAGAMGLTELEVLPRLGRSITRRYTDPATPAITTP